MRSIASILVIWIISMVMIEGAPSGSSCGSGSDIIQYVSFKLLTSHPTKKGSTATFEITMNLKEDIVGPIETTVEMEYQVLFFWAASCLPSSDNCVYHDFCKDLCQGCSCDFTQGTRAITMSMEIATNVPSGNYRATISFKSATGQTGCVYVQGIQVE